MEFWHRRGRELHKLRKAELITLYRSLGGLGGTYPPEKWTKEEVLTSVADIEWRRLPDDAKKAAPEHMSPPCDECGKGQDVSAHQYGGSHNYVVTHDPCKAWVPSREPCAVADCGRPYEHHQTWSLGHEYQAPAEEQPSGAGATADACKKCGRTFVDDGKFIDSAAQYADFPYCRTCVDRCHDSEIADHWCEIDQHRTDRNITTAPREAPAAGVRYVERPSGPPVRVVDGPACMPAVVPNESGELVRAGSLYSDKCAECTTGVSCEDAGRCLFEG